MDCAFERFSIRVARASDENDVAAAVLDVRRQAQIRAGGHEPPVAPDRKLCLVHPVRRQYDWQRRPGIDELVGILACCSDHRGWRILRERKLGRHAESPCKARSARAPMFPRGSSAKCRCPASRLRYPAPRKDEPGPRRFSPAQRTASGGRGSPRRARPVPCACRSRELPGRQCDRS